MYIPNLLKYLAPLEEFGKLEENWDGQDALPPTKKAIEEARVFLTQCYINEHLDEEYGPKIKPLVFGGVGITFLKNDRKVQIEFGNLSEKFALFDDGITGLFSLPIIDNDQLIDQIVDYLGIRKVDEPPESHD